MKIISIKNNNELCEKIIAYCNENWSKVFDSFAEIADMSVTAERFPQIWVLYELHEEQMKRKAPEQKLIMNAPKTQFADAVHEIGTTILVGELAKLLKQKGIETGQNRLYAWLKDHGYLIGRKGIDYNMPTQKSMDMELFVIRETVIRYGDGSEKLRKTTRVTGKGQLYFIGLFLGGKED